MKVRVTKKLSQDPIVIPIRTEFIKLQDFMKFANVCESGGMARPLYRTSRSLLTARSAPSAVKSFVRAIPLAS